MDSVHYSELLPAEFRARLASKPIAYLPLGTLEWHGEHLPYGSDAIQSEGLMIACAHTFGGIVLPPIHLGPDRALFHEHREPLYGMDYADTTTPERQLEGSCYWIPPGLFEILIDSILIQLKRAGFRAVFADGHGPSRWAWAGAIAEREARFGLKLFGVTKDIRDAWTSQIDHAARNETSIMMALRPDLVALDRLGTDPSVWPQGVGGEDPRTSTVEHGQVCLATAVQLVQTQFAAAGF